MRNSAAASYAVFIKRPDVKSEMHKMTRSKRKIVCSWFLPLMPYRWLFAICAWSRENWQCRLILMSEFNKNPNTEEHESQLICNFCISLQTCCSEALLNGIHQKLLSCSLLRDTKWDRSVSFCIGCHSLLWKYSSIRWLPLGVKPPKLMVF